MVTFITLDTLPGFLANTQVTSVSVGNTIINATMFSNATSAYVQTPNTGLLAGSSNIGGNQTNGYSYMPNGLIMQWGAFVANTISKITFSIPFPTACISISVTGTSNNFIGANTITVQSVNTSIANVTSASTNTTVNAYYIAIGN